MEEKMISMKISRLHFLAQSERQNLEVDKLLIGSHIAKD